MGSMIWAERFGKSFVMVVLNNNIMKRIVTVAAIALLGGGSTCPERGFVAPVWECECQGYRY